MEVWEIRAADEGAFNENYLKCIEKVTPEQGVYTIQVKPYSAVTVTSLNRSNDRELTSGLPVEGERPVLDTDRTGSGQDSSSEFLYADNFDYTGKTVPVLDGKGGFTGEKENYIESRGGDTGAIARYTNVINGAFETYKTTDGNYVLRQQLDKKATGTGTAWNNGDSVVVIGDMRWMNYTASIDVMFEKDCGEDNPYAALSIRQTGSSQSLTGSSGYTFKVTSEGEWILYKKAYMAKSGTLTEADGFHAGKNVWNNLRLSGENNVIRAYVGKKLIAEYEDSEPVTAGRIGLGTSFSYTRFDNLSVTKINQTVPYFTELLDDFETYDLTPAKNQKLIYNDKWTHQYGKGMYVYQRTISESTGTRATLTYNFTGTGIDILAGTSQTAVLKVSVDDKVVDSEAKTRTASNLNTIYSLGGLTYGKHKIKVEVVSGKLSVDMVGVHGNVFVAE